MGRISNTSLVFGINFKAKQQIATIAICCGWLTRICIEIRKDPSAVWLVFSTALWQTIRYFFFQFNSISFVFISSIEWLIQVRLIAAHTRFESMAVNPSVNYSHWDDLGLRNKSEARFMRSGRVGDWRRHFDPETNRRFDDFIRQHLDGSQLKFDYLPPDE